MARWRDAACQAGSRLRPLLTRLLSTRVCDVAFGRDARRNFDGRDDTQGSKLSTIIRDPMQLGTRAEQRADVVPCRVAVDHEDFARRARAWRPTDASLSSSSLALYSLFTFAEIATSSSHRRWTRVCVSHVKESRGPPSLDFPHDECWRPAPFLRASRAEGLCGRGPRGRYRRVCPICSAALIPHICKWR